MLQVVQEIPISADLCSPRQTSLSFSPASQNEGLSLIHFEVAAVGAIFLPSTASCMEHRVLLTFFLGKTCLWWHLPYGVVDRLAYDAWVIPLVERQEPPKYPTQATQHPHQVASDRLCFPGLRARGRRRALWRICRPLFVFPSFRFSSTPQHI